MHPTVSSLFASVSNKPSSQLVLSPRVRSSFLGDALVQTAIELNLKYRLDAGLIELISPNSTPPVESEPEEDYEVFCASCTNVQCLIITPVSQSVDRDEVKRALLREGVTCFSVRKLCGGVEASVESSPNIYRLMRRGLRLPHFRWPARVFDASYKSCHRFYCGPLRCLLCGKGDHVRAACFRQVPNSVAAVGG